MVDNLCLFSQNTNPICLPTKLYQSLREKIMKKYNLNEMPSLMELKRMLNVTEQIKLNDRIKEFLNSCGVDLSNFKIIEEYRAQVPNISDKGLSGTNILKIFEFLKKYYPFFHYRGPCLLDYADSWLYNYSDFEKFPLFESKNKTFDIYYMLMLTIKSTTNRPGHWIGFCVVENAIIYYDSLNKEILPEFQNLIQLIILDLKCKHENVLTWRNKKQVQFSGKHCGVFQIHFLTTVLELYSKEILFLNYGNNKTLNTDALSFYLQDDLTQNVIEKTISSYFFVDKY